MPNRGTYAKGAARREEILSTALRMISEQGYHRTSLRGIGRALGVEPANLLYYFRSREDLLREVVQRWDTDSLRALEDDVDALETYVRAIRRNQEIRGVVHLYLAFATEAVDEAHPAHAFFADRFDLVVRMLADCVERGQRGGLIRPELEPERTARMLVALADGLQLQSLVTPSMDATADLEYAIDGLFVGGVRVPVPPP